MFCVFASHKNKVSFTYWNILTNTYLSPTFTPPKGCLPPPNLTIPSNLCQQLKTKIEPNDLLVQGLLRG